MVIFPVRFKKIRNETFVYIKYIVAKMEADQPVTGKTISTGHLYASIESTNQPLDCGITTVGTLRKGRSGIPSELFDTQNRFLVQLVILKRRRRTFA